MFVIMILTLFDYLLGQSQLYYAGKSQYIGVYDTKVEASLAYEIARKLLNSESALSNPPRRNDVVTPSVEEVKANIGLARKAGLLGINQMKESRKSNFDTASWPVRWG